MAGPTQAELPEDEPASFGAFSLYRDQQEEPTHWLAALFGSSIVYVLLAIAAVTIGTAARRIIVEKEVEVKFVEEVAKPEPPPPEPVEVKPPPALAPPAAAAIVPKDMKVRQLDAAAAGEGAGGARGDAEPDAGRGRSEPRQGHRRVRRLGGDVAGLEGGMGSGRRPAASPD